MIRTKRWTAGLVVGGALVGVLAAGAPAGAVTSSATQTVAFTSVGTLQVSVLPLSLPSTATAGTSLANQSVGQITVIDNLADNTAWTLGVTATDLAGADMATNPSDYIPASNMSFTPGTTWGPLSSSTTGVTLNAGAHSFTEPSPDTTPGTTQSPAVTIATGSTTAQGTWYLNGSTFSLSLPGTLGNGIAYSGTLTYTLAG